MNGVANITEKILSEARTWADAQVADSKAQAAATAEEIAQTAATQAKNTLENAQAKAQQITERAKSQGEMDRRKMILSTKQQAVSDAFDAALQKMAGLPEEERVLMMVRLAVKYQTTDAELIFNQKDQAVVGPLVVATVNAIYTRQAIKETFTGNILEQLKKLVSQQPVKHKVTMSTMVGNFAGGFILKEGDIENNCTFEVLVNAVHDDLEGDVTSILFPQ